MKGEYISIDTTKKIAGLEKEIEKLNNIIKELEKDNCRLSYSDEVLNNIIIEKDKEIERLNNIIKEVREWIRIVQTNEDRKHLEPIINTDELDHILEILDKGEIK